MIWNDITRVAAPWGNRVHLSIAVWWNIDISYMAASIFKKMFFICLTVWPYQRLFVYSNMTRWLSHILPQLIICFQLISERTIISCSTLMHPGGPYRLMSHLIIHCLSWKRLYAKELGFIWPDTVLKQCKELSWGAVIENCLPIGNRRCLTRAVDDQCDGLFDSIGHCLRSMQHCSLMPE